MVVIPSAVMLKEVFDPITVVLLMACAPEAEYVIDWTPEPSTLSVAPSPTSTLLVNQPLLPAVPDVVAVVVGAVVSDRFTVIVNVCRALVSTPPLAVPPSSSSCTVMVVVPLEPYLGMKVSVPSGDTAG